MPDNETQQMATGGKSVSFKTPPALSKSSSYENWKKELQVWEKLTDVSKSKRGLTVLLSLEGKAKDAILELEIDDLSTENGLKLITDKLDSLYLKDKAQMAYEAYDNFEKFRRPVNLSTKDYINEFERLLSKTKSYGTKISSDVQAYRLLNSAKFSESQKQLVRATISGNLTYDTMKLKLGRVFEDASGSVESMSEGMVNIKSEIVHEASAYEPHDEVFYGSVRGRGGWRGPYNSRGGYNGSRDSPTANNLSNGSESKFPNRGGYGSRRGRNPINKRGQITRCAICSSVNHYASVCPDVQYFQECHSENPEEADTHHVTLFQSHLLTNEAMKTFVAESMSGAIIDSGATATVSGSVWIDCYLGSLSASEKDKVLYTNSTKLFRFGSGDLFKSLYKVKVPAQIGTKKVFIETDVVETDVPMLLSRPAMKKSWYCYELCR